MELFILFVNIDVYTQGKQQKWNFIWLTCTAIKVAGSFIIVQLHIPHCIKEECGVFLHFTGLFIIYVKENYNFLHL